MVDGVSQSQRSFAPAGVANQKTVVDTKELLGAKRSAKFEIKGDKLKLEAFPPKAKLTITVPDSREAGKSRTLTFVNETNEDITARFYFDENGIYTADQIDSDKYNLTNPKDQAEYTQARTNKHSEGNKTYLLDKGAQSNNVKYQGSAPGASVVPGVRTSQQESQKKQEINETKLFNRQQQIFEELKQEEGSQGGQSESDSFIQPPKTQDRAAPIILPPPPPPPSPVASKKLETAEKAKAVPVKDEDSKDEASKAESKAKAAIPPRGTPERKKFERALKRQRELQRSQRESLGGASTASKSIATDVSARSDALLKSKKKLEKQRLAQSTPGNLGSAGLDSVSTKKSGTGSKMDELRKKKAELKRREALAASTTESESSTKKKTAAEKQKKSLFGDAVSREASKRSTGSTEQQSKVKEEAKSGFLGRFFGGAKQSKVAENRSAPKALEPQADSFRDIEALIPDDVNAFKPTTTEELFKKVSSKIKTNPQLKANYSEELAEIKKTRSRAGVTPRTRLRDLARNVVKDLKQQKADKESELAKDKAKTRAIPRPPVEEKTPSIVTPNRPLPVLAEITLGEEEEEPTPIPTLTEADEALIETDRQFSDRLEGFIELELEPAK